MIGKNETYMDEETGSKFRSMSTDSYSCPDLQDEMEMFEFLNLPWEQVLCNHILTYLTFPDLFKLRCVSKGCKELVETHFNRQFHVNTTHLGDNCTASAFVIITKDCTHLKTLILRGAKSWLTNDVFLPVVTSNPLLEKIDLTGCIALSGCTAYAIGANCPNLKHLSLRNCVWLSRDNLMSFIFNKRTIEYIDLSGCWNLDDETVVNLVQNSSSIKQLLLNNIYGLTDRTLCAVAHSCPKLQTLCIQGCWRVTDSSISLVTEYCLNLKMLQVKECRDITEKSLSALRKRRVVLDKAAPPMVQFGQMEFNLQNQQHINLAL